MLLDLDFAGAADSCSFIALPLLLDLAFAGAAGSISVSGACAAPLLRDLDFAFAAVIDAAADGIAGGSVPLPLDFAGPIDTARFGEGLVGIGCPGSILGAAACALGTDTALPIL